MSWKRSIGVIALIATLSGMAYTQDPSFEAASVKPNRSGDTSLGVNTQGGRVTATNVPLMLLIRLALALPEYRIVNAPDWARIERFDLVATTGGAVSREQQNAMLRTLLRQRFKLAAHSESREMPIYALLRARSDGAPNPSLKSSATNCAALLAAARTGTPLPPSNRILCGAQRRPGGVSVGGMSMSEVAAQVLSGEAGRLVIDRTGLEGAFDFDLDFAPAGVPDAATTDGVPLVTALLEQLGLRLDPQRGPVEVLVVDSVERPTPD